jgi:DNA invertase Pin-like site-specific DNA recombinase
MARKSRKNVDATPIAPTSVFRVGAYVRLSAEDKKVKGDSIETQQAIIKAFIEEHSDLELVEIYVDNGLSGQSFQRPAFNRMIEDMESGKINCCISKDLSRLGRNAIDTGYYIEKFFPTKGVRYIAITDNYDSADPKSGGVMVNLKNMVNEYYALDIGRKIRQTKQMNIRKGKFIGRFAPYGFLKSAEDKHQLIPDPYAAPIVRTMFEMAAQGKGVTAILDWLNDKNELPPKRYFHSKGLATDNDIKDKHIHWSIGSVHTILKNRVYCGDMVQGKFHTQSYRQKPVPKSEWIIVEDTHDGIISRELFEKVQTLRSSNPQSKSLPVSENIFLRKVFCGHCGMSLKRRNNGKKKVKYALACSTRRTHSKDDCVPVSIFEDDLKEALLELLGKQAEVIGIGIEPKRNPQHATEQTVFNAELRHLQKEISINSHYLKSLYESLISNDLTQDEYRELRTGYEAKIVELTAKEKDLRDEMVEAIVKETLVAKAAAQLGGVQQITDLTADILDQLVDKILVYEGMRIEVQFKYSDSLVVSNVNKSERGVCVEHDNTK